MKKQFWFLIAIVLVVLLLGGFAWMRLSKDTSDAASSPNGETEIIPDDPNEPWPDLTADASPDASDGTHSSASDSSNPGQRRECLPPAVRLSRETRQIPILLLTPPAARLLPVDLLLPAARFPGTVPLPPAARIFLTTLPAAGSRPSRIPTQGTTILWSRKQSSMNTSFPIFPCRNRSPF